MTMRRLCVVSVLWCLPWAAAQAPAAEADGGLTEHSLILGQSADFTNSDSAPDAWLGAQAAFDEANAAGGVLGRKVAVIASDDAGDPEEVLANTTRFVDMDGVFALFGYSGTPALSAAMPMLRMYSRQGIFLFSDYSGAEPQRETRTANYILNVRASSRTEADSLVRLLVDPLGARKLGVLIQADPQCAAAAAEVDAALAAHGLSPAAQAELKAPAPGSTDLQDQVGALRDAGALAVVVLAGAAPGAAFVRAARTAGFTGPIAFESLTDADALLAALNTEGKAKALSFTAKLLASQVVPCWSDLSYAVVKDYRAAADKEKTAIPSELQSKAWKRSKYNFAGLEGYLNAKLFLSILAKAPKDLSPKLFVLAAKTYNPWDVGLFSGAVFDGQHPQALRDVFLTTVQDDAWAPLRDPGSLQ
jgi:branched-chain amino acid transport system substrate-binding protein